MGSNKGRRPWRNALSVGATTFFLTLIIGYVSQTFIGRMGSLIVSFSLLIVIILTGILFDILGTAVAAAVEPPFHAKAARKIPGAKEAIWLLRNADRVASFANDVVGDICGTLSGAIGAGILFRLAGAEAEDALLGTAMTAVIAALTVGGKAVGKRMALSEAEEIVFWVGRAIAAMEGITGRPLVKERLQKGKLK
ncbi:MAG: hypothetical protein IMW96_10680 [Thermoanaerobacteraceae bacterium]|uniref:hypothetical protein n=1 Tax=Thermanaeromonas sp. C210 TaxID=2731925 RepID=UPI00155B8490|nr:hypothetical protein [Thermanaeromonas sp. C210]MBE3582076.1 hypothetical protein [Thermoanaerobacteraceae bacterium]GFN23329.1 hypothetical protein TAMC210_16460 [Thermanaeromonas sp. C210]